MCNLDQNKRTVPAFLVSKMMILSRKVTPHPKKKVLLVKITLKA
jgi:hypothetical protein